ncbi:MAG: hypothetical protein ACE5KH_00195 [Candidatus Geothermarchaeales archaeon]
MRVRFGLPIAISIVVGIGWLVFILWHTAFWSPDFNLFQNIVIALVSFLLAGGLIAVTWVVWGFRFWRSSW